MIGLCATTYYWIRLFGLGALVGIFSFCIQTVPMANAAEHAPNTTQQSHKPVSYYIFDKSHTHITFSVKFLKLYKITGEFKDFDGYYIIDSRNPAATEVNLTIKTASISMQNRAQEKWLRGRDFFNVSVYPDLTFTSSRVEGIHAGTAELIGNLTLVGVTKPLQLQIHPTTIFPDTITSKSSGFSASSALDRRLFGMNKSIPVISRDVTLDITVVGTPILTGDNITDVKSKIKATSIASKTL